MEKIPTDGGSDSPPADRANRAAESRPISPAESKPDPDAADTGNPDSTPTAFVVELSLLQSVLDQAITAGLRTQTRVETWTDGRTPILSIRIWNTARCQECNSWHTGMVCPVCS